MIKITPATLGREEMAWLWTALKADYRPTFPFQVSVVLIAAAVADCPLAAGAQPQHHRAGRRRPPQLLQIAAAPGQTARGPGDTVTVTGLSLTGAKRWRSSTRGWASTIAPFAPTAVTERLVAFTVPNDPGEAAGRHLQPVGAVRQGSGGMLQTTNALPFAIAPENRHDSGCRSRGRSAAARWSPSTAIRRCCPTRASRSPWAA